MMMSPEAYKEELDGMGIDELAALRDELMESVKAFESGSPEEGEIIEGPDPEVVYQVELLYLAKVCEALSEKYNRSVIWGE